jgi:hypothetical protein
MFFMSLSYSRDLPIVESGITDLISLLYFSYMY